MILAVSLLCLNRNTFGFNEKEFCWNQRCWYQPIFGFNKKHRFCPQKYSIVFNSKRVHLITILKSHFYTKKYLPCLNLFYIVFYYIVEAICRAISPGQYHFRYCPSMAVINISELYQWFSCNKRNKILSVHNNMFIEK